MELHTSHIVCSSFGEVNPQVSAHSFFVCTQTSIEPVQHYIPHKILKVTFSFNLEYMKSLEKYRIMGGGKKNHPETSVNILKSF